MSIAPVACDAEEIYLLHTVVFHISPVAEVTVPTGDGRLRPPGTLPTRGFLDHRLQRPATLRRQNEHLKPLCETREAVRLGKGRAKGGGRRRDHPHPALRRGSHGGCPARWPRLALSQAPPPLAPSAAASRPGWPVVVGRRRVGSWREGRGGRRCARLSRELPRGDPRCFAAARPFLAARPSWRRVSGEWVSAGAARAGAGGRCRVLTPPPVHPCVPVTARPDARQQHGGREEDGEWERAAPASRGGGPASASGGRCAGAGGGGGAGRVAVWKRGPRHGLGRGPAAAGGPGHSRRRLSRPSELGPCPPRTGCGRLPPASLSSDPSCALSGAAYRAPVLAHTACDYLFLLTDIMLSVGALGRDMLQTWLRFARQK